MEQLIESRMKAVEEKEDHKKYLKESGPTDRRTAGKQLENKKRERLDMCKDQDIVERGHDTDVPPSTFRQCRPSSLLTQVLNWVKDTHNVCVAMICNLSSRA